MAETCQLPNLRPPTLVDVMRYRLHHGANLGSVFVLERWLTPSMFPSNAIGQSELCAAEAWAKLESLSRTKERFETHWRQYVNDGDLDWLKDVAKCTTVRLPIGYFTLGPAFCARTPFERVAGVYADAWGCVLELVRRCSRRGIGVLLDLHALPGGANTGIHSGTDAGVAEFWCSMAFRHLATQCLIFIAKEVKGVDGVVGIQLVNEAEFEAPRMYDWYDSVLSELGKIDASLPIYISDGWNLKQAIDWSQRQNSLTAPLLNPIAIDTHCYWCFSTEDKQKPPQQIINDVPASLSALKGKDGNIVDRGAAQVVVGEYSCVLDNKTWGKRNPTTPRNEIVSAFGKAQCEHFQRRAGGSFFWSYRMDWMNGGEWGFRQMTEAHAISTPAHLELSRDEVRKRISVARAQREARGRDAVAQHNRYWDGTYPGHYEHWRFEHGWGVGIDDALAYFQMRGHHGLEGADKIGMLDLWCLKRLREGGERLSGGGFGWEFEQGMREGVRDFQECVRL
ncbi:glycoside hydrolase superfamily [Neohortaea acidophila]|uniref:Glycoside hydrolase superfamily n=1 Tax=Neohortaea acidophila TaxID=245834 RepID=A0A6A6PX23_9PEZI|nr:glycoside hydrolase superfamily [Neohortaea acidophila]KAF2484249.1 glycoside hydrolase superfamily [Neohortaea acidophila]